MNSEGIPSTDDNAPPRQMRAVVWGDRQIGLLVWLDDGRWKSAWNVDHGRWHVQRDVPDSENLAGLAALRAAQRALSRGRRRSHDDDTTPVAPEQQTRAWRQLHSRWRDARARLRHALRDHPGAAADDLREAERTARQQLDECVRQILPPAPPSE